MLARLKQHLDALPPIDEKDPGLKDIDELKSPEWKKIFSEVKTIYPLQELTLPKNIVSKDVFLYEMEVQGVKVICS